MGNTADLAMVQKTIIDTLHRESIGYFQEEDKRHQTQQYIWPEGRYQSNLGFHYTWAVP